MDEKLKQLLNDKKCVAVACNQWGDTGKGKFVDLLSEWADIIIRGTGGANAGHTIKLNNKEYIFHLIPSGILHDTQGKINVIGRGVAFDANILLNEINVLEKEGIIVKNLKLSHQASLVLPYHLLVDRIKDKKSKIGTTGRGIGPLYSDYVSRVGLFVNDIFNPELFKQKLKKFLESKKVVLDSFDKDMAKEVLSHEHLLNGRFYNEKTILDFDAMVDYYTNEVANKLKDFIIDLDVFVKDALKNNKKILLEGAQGLLLSIDYGTTKYQTSSDCSIEGLAKGCSLKEEDVDLIFGITKAFYMTRVGNGPFPTELGGKKSEEYCASGYNKDYEKEQYKDVNELLSSDDDFKLGIGFRFLGSEYGATTGRTRRTGWLDLVALKYAIAINKNNIVLTKVDVLTGVKKIKVCVAYKYNGEDVFYAGKTLKKGDIINYFPRFSEILYDCIPVYKEFDGWNEDIRNIRDYEKLPLNLKNLINFTEEFISGKVIIVSVGPDRSENIIKV